MNNDYPPTQLPEAVLNLLNLHSMYAYWDQREGWRIKLNSSPLGRSTYLVWEGCFVRGGAPLDEWISAIERLSA